MRLVVFDIDGTLIHSGGSGRRALEGAIAAVWGVQSALSGYSLGGKTDPLILDYVAQTHLDNGHLTEDTVAPVLERYLALLEEGLRNAQGYKVLDGVTDILPRLDSEPSVALALGTGNIESGARLKLERGDLNRYFPVGGFGSDAHLRADVIGAAVDKSVAHYGRSFDEVWIVGDTIHDVTAGHAHGHKVLAVATGVDSREVLASASPELLVDTLSDDIVADTLLGW